MDIISLKESINSVISEDGDNPENESQYLSLMKNIESSFLENFPNGFFTISESKRFSHSISIAFGLIKELSDVTNKIRQNDPMFGQIFIWLNTAPNYKVELSVGGLSVNPDPGTHYAMKHLKFPWRNFKTTDLTKIENQFKVFFGKLKDLVKANQENIYRVEDIPQQYFVESSVSEDTHEDLYNSGFKFQLNSGSGAHIYFKSQEDKKKAQLVSNSINPIDDEEKFLKSLTRRGIEYKLADKPEVKESLTGNSSHTVNVNTMDLLSASNLIAKYPGQITISPVSKNKFVLTLNEPTLLDKDPLIAKLFSKGVQEENSNPIPAGYEDPTEVFSNEFGKVFQTLKDGKHYFFGVLSNGSVMGNGRALLSKSVAVSLLKTVAK
jgi:hypothetical protein